MLRFSSLPSFLLKFRAWRSGGLVFCLAAAFLTLPTFVSAQVPANDFSLTMAAFDPIAVNPGQMSSSNISLVAGTGFNSTVSLTCQITSSVTNSIPPQCTMSPTTVTVQPSGSAFAKIVTEYVGDPVTCPGPPAGDCVATAGAYTVIVTGTGGGKTHQGSATITVQAVSPAFTITVTSPVSPTNVHAGSGGIGTVSVNPIFGYQGLVTLSCASITPLVTVPPACLFNYGGNNKGVQVDGIPATAQVSIITFGPTPTTFLAHARTFYALWLPLPLLVLTGFGAATGGKKSRKAWLALSLFVLGGTLLLVPACSNTTTTIESTVGTTPNDSYTFTLMGTDTNGNTSTNTGTANEAPSITITVD